MTPSSATGLEVAGVSVKPLEWKDSEVQSAALEPFGAWFFVNQAPDGKWSTTYGGPHLYIFDTRDEAKAAAQRDYVARIMSALDPSPLTERIERLTRERDDAVAALALIREEAAKDNAPYGRSDSIALNHIRALTSETPQP